VARAGAVAAHHRDDDSENIQYGIVASGPPVLPEEVESNDMAIEVSITWGEQNVLHLEHLSPPRAYYVGEAPVASEPAQERPVDYLIGSEVLGTDRMPVVVESGGNVAVVVPPGATGEVLQGEEVSTLEQLRIAGQLQPSSAVPGAMQYPLPPESTVKVRLKDFVFVVRPVKAGRKLAGHLSVDWRSLAYMGGSALIFSLLLGVFHFLPPRAAALSIDNLDPDKRVVKSFMIAAEEEMRKRQEEEEEDRRYMEEYSQRLRDKMEEAAKKGYHLDLEGPSESDCLCSIGWIPGDYLSAMVAGAPLGAPIPSAAPGFFPSEARIGDQLAASFGVGGLGLRPKIRWRPMSVRGSLSKEVIHRLIRRHSNEVHFCSEQELNQGLDLNGGVGVNVKFIISPAGAVLSALVSTRLEAPHLVRCIAQAVRRWSFPAPDDGNIVIVDFPFDLSTSDN
jgi:hypothetical protein